jgi:SsrA-binding protein
MAPKGVKVVASNRRARHDYVVLDTIECGLVLAGSEVKSLRDAKVQLGDAYARVERGELWLHNMHIAPYEHASGFGAHAADRPRKLLAHRSEIERLGAKVAQDHLTLVPLSVYFKEGRAKVELALAKGRKSHDRRQDIAKRDANRDIERALKGYDHGA